VARFRFRLQPVLEHRRRLEELAQIELAQAQAVQQREEAALQSLHERARLAVDRLEQQRLAGPLDIEVLLLGMRYLDVLKGQADRQQQVVERLREQAEAKRQALIGSMQQRKVLEQLRERQRNAFLLEQRRQEARQVDELVVMRHGRAARHASQGS
jgi:flagellar FliJ protein